MKSQMDQVEKKWTAQEKERIEYRDTRMNCRGCGAGPLQNANVQGPDFSSTPLHPLLIKETLISAALSFNNIFCVANGKTAKVVR